MKANDQGSSGSRISGFVIGTDGVGSGRRGLRISPRSLRSGFRACRGRRLVVRSLSDKSSTGEKPRSPTRNNRSAREDFKGSFDSEPRDEDVVQAEYEIACPDYVRVRMPLGEPYEPGESDDGDGDESIMYKLEWRRNLEEWNIYGDGTFVSESRYLAKSEEVWVYKPEAIPIDELGLDVLHPGSSLDQAQVAAIRALCERRSVIYSSPEQDSELVIARDVSLRSLLGEGRMIYCSPSRRKTERVFALIAETIGEENVGLDLHDVRENIESLERDWPCALIVSPEILHEMIFNAERRALHKTDVVILDDFVHPEHSYRLWEEIIVAMPTRILVALLCKRLSERDMVEIPLWFNHVMNACCKAFRLTRAVPCKAFVVNALTDTSLRQVLIDSAGRRSYEEFSSALQIAEEAEEQADEEVLATTEKTATEAAERLLSGRPGPALTLRDSLILSSMEIESDSATVAQILVRGGSNLPNPRVERLPLLALVYGRDETEMTVRALISALRGESIVDVEDETAIRAAMANAKDALEDAGAMTGDVEEWFDSALTGCTCIHRGLLPVQNALADELFRANLVKVLVVDSFIGTRDLSNLPAARTVVVDAVTISHHARAGKGVVHGSIVKDMVGRRGEDEEGMLVVCWEDQEFTPNEMAVEAVAALTSPYPVVLAEGVGSHPVSILRTIHRFGGEDWQQLWTLSLGELRRSIDCEPLSVEKIRKEQELTDLKRELGEVDWLSMAKYARIEAKLQERARILSEMFSQMSNLWEHFVYETLFIAPIGAIVGLKIPKDDGEGEEKRTVYGDRAEAQVGLPNYELMDEKTQPAVLVEVRRGPGGGDDYAIVIGSDSLFARVPLSCIYTVETEYQPITVPDDLQVPLDAEFDLTSESSWGICKSADAKANNLAEAVASELRNLQVVLFRQYPGELENQIVRYDRARRELQSNPWFGMDDEMARLRLMRREMLIRERDIGDLQKQIDVVMEGAPRRRSLPKRVEGRLRLLDELNCTSPETKEISPMGMVTLSLCCESQFWVMAGMMLTDAAKSDWFELAGALVAQCSNFSKTLGHLYEGGEYREEFSSGPVVSQMLDLRDNIRAVEDKHEIELDGRMLTPLDTRLSRMVRNWVQQDQWEAALQRVDLGGLGPGDVVEVLRNAIGIARQFADAERQPWIVDDLQRKMRNVAKGLDRIPVKDFELLKETDRLVVQAREDTPDVEDVRTWWSSGKGRKAKSSRKSRPRET
ncbi:hypothetical protein NDN08_007572 [Rhodosorus marinus]|uniref:ATP-dependent RNA helicase Ski2/MTR4 C-terminal domain-containing protein n=1 Tax=Rhodosorus marinus TaxID=101924 RepID=A0AAV8UXY2_9RHOD|nr:hypothetical protein NDN08_007572 [Rhodosorus marinus]